MTHVWSTGSRYIYIYMYNTSLVFRRTVKNTLKMYVYIYIFLSGWAYGEGVGEGGEGWSNSVTENSIYVAIRLDQL